jgi:hypothetical protein
MTEQLNLLGDQAQPVDDELGPVQKAVMRVIRRTETLSWDEAGAISHAHRGKHSVDDRCMFCGTDGANVCESLIRRGLVEPAKHGFVRLPTPKLPEARPDRDQWPEGF